jgi:dihydroneopterin aldolase
MTLVIELEGLELHGYHGVLPEERRDGQRFLVDVTVEPVAGTAGASDRLVDTVDYRAVVAVVQEVFDAERYRLLEALTTAIADELVRALPLRSARVRVRKPEVRLAVPVEHSAVVVERLSEPGP